MSMLTPPPTGGPQILWHELLRRWKAFVVGVLIGGVLAALYLVLLPGAHTATATVTITTPSATPEQAARTSLSSTDMVTEKAVAQSAVTLNEALGTLNGMDLSLEKLKGGLSVAGGTDGTIVTISWSGKNRDEAVKVTDAITNAYINQRAALIKQRADEMSAKITERITALNDEAAGLNGDSSRATAIQTELSDLAKQQDQLLAYQVTSARVLTSASDSPDQTTPSKGKILAAGLAVGAVLGLAIGLTREHREKRVLSAGQLADLTGLPVWGAQVGVATAVQWDAPAQVASLAIGKDLDLVIVADGGDTRALAFTDALARARRIQAAAAPILVDLRMPLAEIIGRLGGNGRILIGATIGAPLADLHELLDQLAVANRDVVGLVVFDDRAEVVLFGGSEGQQGWSGDYDGR